MNKYLRICKPTSSVVQRYLRTDQSVESPPDSEPPHARLVSAGKTELHPDMGRTNFSKIGQEFLSGRTYFPRKVCPVGQIFLG